MIDIDRLVVTGGFGQIGRSMNFGIHTDRTEIDVTDQASVLVGLCQLKASAVVNLASIDLRPSQADPATALRVNVEGTYNIAQAARELDIPVFLITTGAVFNGAFGETFDETATPEPQCVYAKTKHMAELIVQTLVPEFLIIRTGWLFALNVAPRKKFVEVVMAAAANNKRVQASNDQSGSPTYTPDFIKALKNAIAEGHRGTIHIVNEGTASAADIADVVYGHYGLTDMVDPVSFREFAGDVPRSSAEGMTSNILKLRPWTEALAEYVKQESA